MFYELPDGQILYITETFTAGFFPDSPDGFQHELEAWLANGNELLPYPETQSEPDSPTT